MMEALTLPVAFLAGIAAFASPCFLPIVPVFLTYLMGQDGSRYPALAGAASPAAKGFLTAQQQVVVPVRPRPAVSRSWALRNSLMFVVAFTLVFVSLWGAISLLGWVVGDLRPALRVGGGVILILLGLFTVGLLKVPVLERTWRPSADSWNGEPSLRRSALMGLAFGAGWSPCIGPVLGAILGMAIAGGQVAAGIGMLLVFSAGMGLPFVLLALGATSLTERLVWISRHHRAVRMLSGVLMIAMGFLMVTDLLAPLSGFKWFGI